MHQKVSRRAFLKAVSIFAIMPLNLDSPPRFNRLDYTELGEAIAVAPGVKYLDIVEDPSHPLLTSLHQKAKQTLRPGTYYEIRAKVPTKYGLHRGIAWYTLVNAKGASILPVRQTQDRKMVLDDGYFFVGGYHA